MPDVARSIGGLAIGIGALIAAAVGSIAAYYAVGARGPLGPINDILNGAAGAMTSILAFSLHRHRLGGAVGGVAAAVLGGGVVVWGSILVLTSRTGWLFAGLVSGVGFALLGVWLALLNRSPAAARFPRGLRRLGVGTGVVMSLGFVLLPAIVARYDDAESAPWWVWLGFQGLAGTYVLYPVWAIWLGRILRRPARVRTRRDA